MRRFTGTGHPAECTQRENLKDRINSQNIYLDAQTSAKVVLNKAKTQEFMAWVNINFRRWTDEINTSASFQQDDVPQACIRSYML